MSSFDRHHDTRVRAIVFEWLSEQVARHGDILPRDVIARGLEVDGQRVALVGPPGIFKPRILAVPISITTTPNSPYDDTFSPGDLLYYRYRGTDPRHRDNVGLRFAMEEQIPLVYFYGVVPVVSNGMSLCRLHHAAFDRHFVGVTPDYELKVRPDILEEEDGPTLVHGLQALEGERIALPRSASDRPNPELLERRWGEFQEEVARAG